MPAAIAGSCLAVTCLFFGAIALLLLGVAEKREGRWKLLCSYGDNIWDLCWMLREDGIYMVFSDLWNLYIHVQMSFVRLMEFCMHACMHPSIHTSIHPSIHTYMHICIHTYTFIHTCTHTRIHTYTNTHTYAHTQTYIHAYMHACIHTYNRLEFLKGSILLNLGRMAVVPTV